MFILEQMSLRVRTRMIVTAVSCVLSSTSFAATFSVSGPGGSIPDNPLQADVAAFDWNNSFAATGGTPFTSTVVLSSPVTSVTTVQLHGFSHTRRGDLHLLLTDPTGVAHNLVVRPGFGAGFDLVGDTGDYNLGDYTLVDSGGNSLQQGATNIAPGVYNCFYNASAPWTNGSSDTPLANITGAAGVWTLEVRDWANGDTGSLAGWTLTGTNSPASAFHAFCAGDGTLTDHTSACPCGNNGAAGNGCAHSFDPNGANLSATGTATANDVVLRSQFEPANSFTLFMQHSAAGDTIFHDGTLCAGGALIRLRGRPAIAGAASFPNSLFANDSTTTLAQRGGVFPGQGVRRYYAAWYRNASTTFCPPATANVTNGWLIDW
jgi:subtilisin-like proprotein convertase family protein